MNGYYILIGYLTLLAVFCGIANFLLWLDKKSDGNSNAMVQQNSETITSYQYVMHPEIGVRKKYKCSKCQEKRACVVKIENNLICIKCRSNEIGVEAFYEPLYKE